MLKIFFVMCAVVGINAAQVHAQSAAYPSKPVRVIVLLTAGSSADIVTRTITPKLAETFGQQFIVDNRVGFSGNIGAEAAARAAPDVGRVRGQRHQPVVCQTQLQP